MEQYKGIKSIPSRTAFAPFFRQRWQNMQNIINDEVFMSMAPPAYLTYYQAFIRQWLQWSTGFVPMLHRGDFFSTGMGYTVCDIFAEECMSGGYRIDSPNEELKKGIEDWASYDLDNILSKMFFFANAGGNAILALTPVNGDVYPSVIPINRIYFQIGRHGEITEALILNRFVAGESAFYAKEYRVMMDGKAYYRVTLGEGTLVTSPSWNTAPITRIPESIRTQWDYAYGDIFPGMWYQLPPAFKTTGLYNVKNKSVAVALADLPGYSDSTLHTALDVLYSIDYNYTQQQIDMYMGKSRALIPKEMQTRQITGVNGKIAAMVANGVPFAEAVATPQLNDEFYMQIPSTSIKDEPIKPYFIQPDLRGEAHKYIRDSDLELLSSKVRLSSSTLANHLTYNTSKTATEVRGEQDTTDKSRSRKRALAKRAIDAMLSDVAKFYNYSDRVEITWGRSGVNTAIENQELLADYQAGTMGLRSYLKRRWPDLSEEDIDKEINEIRQEADRIFSQEDYMKGILNEDSR